MKGVLIQISATRMLMKPSGTFTSQGMMWARPVREKRRLLTSPTWSLKNHLN